jgi:alginate O-acetyltransferase complex protein AlgI
MVFTSIEFIVFFSGFYVLFLLISHRFRLQSVLLASFAFFGYASPQHLWLLVATILISYVGGLAIAADPGRKRLYLVATVGSLLGLLAFFKYADFAISMLNSALSSLQPAAQITPLGILLPIGISFFVFQAISYIVDVYRGDKQVERNLVVLALFKAFFPQLVAGPIERSTTLLPNIRRAFIDGRAEDLVTRDSLRSGSQLILLGFFKKVCVADNLSLYADNIFANPTAYGSFAAALGVYCFALQIYCDFSGYTDIARGVSRLMGIELMENFRRPYFAKSIREFWTRWHISLSNWFRDYLFKPLGGSRVGAWRWAANIMVVFLLSGLWHGAAVNFVIWGTIHGIIYLVENVAGRVRHAFRGGRAEDTDGVLAVQPLRLLTGFVAALATFHAVCFAWIFFRARTFEEAMAVVSAIVGTGTANSATLGLDMFATSAFAWCMAMAAALLIVDAQAEWRSQRLQRLMNAAVVRWTLYALAALAVVFLGNWNSAQQFIYFQF